MTPEPMPHPNEDRDHLAARASKATFAEDVNAIRGNVNYSDRYKAQQISDRYDQHVTETSQAYESIIKRRRARLSYLEGLVPVGPGIPEKTTPADKAVLMTAFRAALATVKNATREERAALLVEAEKFDDEAMRRAVLTYTLEIGELDTVKIWTDRHVDVADFLDEAAKLRALLEGSHFDNTWDALDFNPAPKPPEAYDWDRMKDAPAGAEVGHTTRPGIVEYRR